jgi:hypothetical protein
MKTKNYLRFPVAGVLMILLSCNNNQSTNTETSSESAPAQTNALVTQVPGKHTIPVADIKAMIGKYKTDRQEMVNGNAELKRSYGENFQDTRCAWFSIEDLKAFIAESEQNPNYKLNGIRMYYTVYPEKKEGESEYMSSIPEKDRNHTSLLLVPTYRDDKTRTDSDFGPEGGAKPNQDGEEKGAQKSSAITPTQESAPALNHAALCPPNCPTAIPNCYLND